VEVKTSTGKFGLQVVYRLSVNWRSRYRASNFVVSVSLRDIRLTTSILEHSGSTCIYYLDSDYLDISHTTVDLRVPLNLFRYIIYDPALDLNNESHYSNTSQTVSNPSAMEKRRIGSRTVSASLDFAMKQQLNALGNRRLGNIDTLPPSMSLSRTP